MSEASIKSTSEHASLNLYISPNWVGLVESESDWQEYLPYLALMLTKEYHISNHREKNSLRRTGKPESPAKVRFVLPSSTQPDWSICPVTFEELNEHKTLPSDWGVYTMYFSDFWQHKMCLKSPLSLWPISPPPQRMILSNGRRHPFRLPRPDQGKVIYTRYIPRLADQHQQSCNFSMRIISIKDNLQDFHDWHNSERVNKFWGERGSIEAHREYIERQLADPHVIPVIAYFNETAFAYFELYYAAEDNIGVHADAGPYDMGWHALVGNEAFRGPKFVQVWISCVTHYLFLADPRTQRVMLEPRVDNEKFIQYLTQDGGYVVEKEFNFPHKRAALVIITREKFFETQGIAT